jgi:hypothetical protein
VADDNAEMKSRVQGFVEFTTSSVADLGAELKAVAKQMQRAMRMDFEGPKLALANTLNDLFKDLIPAQGRHSPTTPHSHSSHPHSERDSHPER